MTEAAQHKISGFSVIPCDADALTNITASLVSKVPVLLAISVYESFESEEVASTGTVPMPNTSTEQLLGGHEVLIIGMDSNQKLATVMNSWGSQWGKNGTFTLPFDYITDANLTQQLTTVNV